MKRFVIEFFRRFQGTVLQDAFDFCSSNNAWDEEDFTSFVRVALKKERVENNIIKDLCKSIVRDGLVPKLKVAHEEDLALGKSLPTSNNAFATPQQGSNEIQLSLPSQNISPTLEAKRVPIAVSDTPRVSLVLATPVTNQTTNVNLVVHINHQPMGKGSGAVNSKGRGRNTKTLSTAVKGLSDANNN